MLKKNESASRGATGFTRLARVLSECLLVLGVILFLAVLVAPNLSLVSRASASVETGLKPADKIGVHQLWLWRDSEARVDEVLDQMSAAGVKWLRMDFGWADLEPVQGTWDFSGHQMVVDKANERGINILGILSTTPTSGWRRVSVYLSTEQPGLVEHLRARDGFKVRLLRDGNGE